MPERLRPFDLVASHHQIKKIHLCDLSDSAVKQSIICLHQAGCHHPFQLRDCN
jgi:hypothetical protein